MLADPGYKFCPKCGASLDKRRLKAIEPERLVCTQCRFVMYLNPKVAAGAVVDFEGGIVLLRREIEPRAGFWVHPGGFVDRGETLQAAAKRETWEEVGLEVEIGRLLGAYSFVDSEVVVTAYAATTISGTPIAGDESLEVHVYQPQEIPWDELAFPSTHLALREYVRTMDLTDSARAVRRKSASSPLANESAGEVTERIEALLQARKDAREARDARAASLVYPPLIRVLREQRRFREALEVAEEGLALTHDPLIARIADEVAHELAASEQERC
ncbi:MAG: NUDIX hydrolase [Vicinamibacteria bacterium]